MTTVEKLYYKVGAAIIIFTFTTFMGWKEMQDERNAKHANHFADTNFSIMSTRYYKKCALLAKQNKLDELINYSTKAIEEIEYKDSSKSKFIFDFLQFRGNAYFKKNKLKEAAPDFQRVCINNMKSPCMKYKYLFDKYGSIKLQIEFRKKEAEFLKKQASLLKKIKPPPTESDKIASLRNKVHYNVKKGITSFKLGDLKATKKFFKKAMKLDPKNPYPHVKLGFIKSSIGENEVAIKYFDQAIKLDPKSHTAHYGKSQTFLKEKKYEDAISSIDTAYSIKKKGTYKFARAKIYWSSGKYEKAIEELKKIKVKGKSAASVNSYIGDCFMNIGDFDKGKEILENSIKVKSRNTDAYLFLAQGYIKANKEKKAIEYYKKAAKKGINKFDANYFLGKYEEKKEKMSLAMDYYQKALNINPNNYDLNLKLSAWYFHENLYRKALKCSLIIAKAEPNNWKIRFKIAICKKFLDNVDGALEDFEKLLKSTNEPKEKSDCYEEMALIFFDDKDWRNSNQYFALAEQENPGDIGRLYNYGLTSIVLRKDREAINIFHKLNQFDKKESTEFIERFKKLMDKYNIVIE